MMFGGPLNKEKIKSLGLGAIIAYGCFHSPDFLHTWSFLTMPRIHGV
jgi:hypothetical protein